MGKKEKKALLFSSGDTYHGWSEVHKVFFFFLYILFPMLHGKKKKKLCYLVVGIPTMVGLRSMVRISSYLIRTMVRI